MGHQGNTLQLGNFLRALLLTPMMSLVQSFTVTMEEIFLRAVKGPNVYNKKPYCSGW